MYQVDPVLLTTEASGFFKNKIYFFSVGKYRNYVSFLTWSSPLINWHHLRTKWLATRGERDAPQFTNEG